MAHRREEAVLGRVPIPLEGLAKATPQPAGRATLLCVPASEPPEVLTGLQRAGTTLTWTLTQPGSHEQVGSSLLPS